MSEGSETPGSAGFYLTLIANFPGTLILHQVGYLRVCRFQHNYETGPVIAQVGGLAVGTYWSGTYHAAVLACFVCQALCSSFGGFPLRSS